MFMNLRIKNFRGLPDLSVDRLGRINLISGRNNSGKSTLLESIFLLSGWGNPELALSINAFRGVDKLSSSPVVLRDIFWKPLFSKLAIDNKVEIFGKYQNLGRLKLTMSLSPNSTTEIQFREPEPLPATSQLDQEALEFLFAEGSIQELRGAIHLTAQGLTIDRPKKAAKYRAIFLSSRSGDHQEDAARLGNLRMRKQGDIVVKALQKIEPDLQNIEVSTAGGSPMIWGDIGLAELIPLPMMGEGLTRIASLVLAIANSANGVVLVDEIENGLHHSVLPKVWKTIEHAAGLFNTQIFATTHSYECVQAASSSTRNDMFLYHRLQRVERKVVCTTYNPTTLDAAIEHDLEIR